MMTIRPGNYVHQLLKLVCVSGEIPAQSLSILGNERVLKRLVHKLEVTGDIRWHEGGPSMNIKVFVVRGTRDKRTVRLHKKAIPLLAPLHPRAVAYYLEVTFGHNLPGDMFHMWRNHRVAEVMAMGMMAGVDVNQYGLPRLQKEKISCVVPKEASLYAARNFKKSEDYTGNKTNFTRIIGALFTQSQVYAIYNTQNSVMKWSGMGEYKAKQNLIELARMNAGINDVDSAIMFGRNITAAFDTVIQSDTTKKMEMRFDRSFIHIHFLPLAVDGIQLLRILALPNWREKLLGTLFTQNQRVKGYGFMEYDAQIGDRFVLSFLDSDIARLIRFRQGIAIQPLERAFEVVCYPWQFAFLKAYLPKRVTLKLLDVTQLEKALGLTKGV